MLQSAYELSHTTYELLDTTYELLHTTYELADTTYELLDTTNQLLHTTVPTNCYTLPMNSYTYNTYKLWDTPVPVQAVTQNLQTGKASYELLQTTADIYTNCYCSVFYKVRKQSNAFL